MVVINFVVTNFRILLLPFPEKCIYRGRSGISIVEQLRRLWAAQS